MDDLLKKVNIKKIFRDNAVTILFVAMCLVSIQFSGQNIGFILFELSSRISRNAFIVLALIIPIIAGMGINFAITIGAMAAQIAILWVLEWKIPGVPGFFLTIAMTIPLASLFGFLVGTLLNKMKGQEMIGSMILGYFANGLYQLLFLFVFGNLIPLKNTDLAIVGSTGVGNTMDVSKEYGFKYALDNIYKIKFLDALPYILLAVVAYYLVKYLLIVFSKKQAALKDYHAVKKRAAKKALIIVAIVCIGVRLLFELKAISNMFALVTIPVATYAIIALLCVFNSIIMKTRLGQRIRAVGQNRSVANASGINVDRTRVIAIVFSTVLAGIGQLVFVQNMGSLQTYGAHEQVGLFAGAAILVGGASIMRATNAQAILGCILFHTLFIVAPQAGKNIFGDAQIGEYFRVFVSYGVIALALVLHAWRSNNERKPGRIAQASGS